MEGAICCGYVWFFFMGCCALHWLLRGSVVVRVNVHNLLLWICVFVMALLVMVRPAHADTIPATQTQLPQWCVPTNGWCASTTRHTKAETCSVINSYWPSNAPYSPVDTGGAYGFGFCDSPVVGATDPAINQAGTWTSYSCPSGYNLDAGGTTCTSVVVCPAAGTPHSNGYFNVGTLPSGKLLNTACVNSCKVELFNGVVPAARQKINGVYYYFGKAEYKHSGISCSPDTPTFLSDFVGALPGSTCAAGQQMISMNGVTKCFYSDGTEVNPNSASAVAAAQTLKDAKAASAVAAAQTAAQAAGLSASGVEQAKAIAAGLGGAGGASGGLSSSDPVQAAFCSENPDAPICKAQTEGARTVATTGVGSLHTKGTKTVSSVMGDFRSTVQASPIVASTSGFFTATVPNLSCPSWHVETGLFSFDYDFLCSQPAQYALTVIKAVMIIVAAYAAFFIAVL